MNKLRETVWSGGTWSPAWPKKIYFHATTRLKQSTMRRSKNSCLNFTRSIIRLCIGLRSKMRAWIHSWMRWAPLSKRLMVSIKNIIFHQTLKNNLRDRIFSSTSATATAKTHEWWINYCCRDIISRRWIHKGHPK